MRFLLAALAVSLFTTSNGSKGNSIQLNIVKLTFLIHLLEEALHLIQREGDALLSSEFHHPLKRSLWV